ncbi:D-2-hydroxyacid dehydrogenase [Thalassobaculum sp.]|uniref:D-2-hydroxyacid dehydrogenase n=1 Tax=Thalassobaculum sp. TaxID=2022740 RepID=UPI0032EE9F40
MSGLERVRLHVKNNRAGEDVFRMTEARVAEAAARRPEVAGRVDTLIDFDLDRFSESMRTSHALVTWDLPTEDLRRRAPALRWIHIIGAGVEHLRPLDWLPPGVVLTNNRGVHAEKTAESALMAVLMLNNRIPAYVTDQRARRWAPVFATPVVGKTVAVVGVGEMGHAAARAFRRAGLRVLGVRRGGRPRRSVDRMVGPDRLHEVLAEADFVHVATPLTEETRHLIDGRAMDAMKPGAGLVKFGRGPVVDVDALAERLRDGRLGGAVLDVHDPEPLPSGSPLWDVPNLILTPHVSSDDDVSYVPKTLDLVFDNLGRLLAGRPLRNRVRPALGY